MSWPRDDPGGRRRSSSSAKTSPDRCRKPSCLAAITCSAALVVIQVAGLVRLKHLVAAAADLSALAASRVSVNGDDPCDAATTIAQRNGAKVLTCRMDFDVATITARGTSRTWWGHRWAFEQKARAVPDFYVGD
ncbi:MAG: TadE-like protein [Aeromicrobium sp.]|nr:TadE-like protein [Aeromicrobium sp.]